MLKSPTSSTSIKDHHSDTFKNKTQAKSSNQRQELCSQKRNQNQNKFNHQKHQHHVMVKTEQHGAAQLRSRNMLNTIHTHIHSALATPKGQWGINLFRGIICPQASNHAISQASKQTNPKHARKSSNRRTKTEEVTW